LNILIYCLSSVSGGAVAYLRNLAPLLVDLIVRNGDRHNLKFLAHTEQGFLFKGIDNSLICWVRGLRPKGFRRVWWEWQNLPQIVKEQKIDILFTPYQIGPHVNGVKRVLMIRNMEPFYFGAYHYSLKSILRNYLLRWQSSRMLQGAGRVISVSGFAEDQLKEGLDIPPDLIRKIYHGRDADFSPEGDPITDRIRLKMLGVEGNFLLTCGSLLPYRRCEDVIAAFNLLCADSLGGEIKLVIAGSGSDASYAKTIRRAILDSPYRNRIIAVGHVSKESMMILYRRCLSCIIATEIEACPNIAIEAMSSGCAIISSDRPPLPEMFAGSSLVFASRNVENLASQIRMCLSDETLRRKMVERAQKRALDFSWEKCAEETYAALVEWPEG